MEDKNIPTENTFEASFRTKLIGSEETLNFMERRQCESTSDVLNPDDENNEVDDVSEQYCHLVSFVPVNSRSHDKGQEETSTNKAVANIQPPINKQMMTLPIEEILPKDNTDDDTVSTLESQEKDQRSIFGNYWTSKNENPSGFESVRKASLTSQETASSTLSSLFDNDIEHFVITGNKDDSEKISYQEYIQCSTKSFEKKSFYGYEDLIKENEEGRTFLPRATALNDNVQFDDDELQENHLNTRSSSETRRSLFSHKYSEERTAIQSYGYMSSSGIGKSSSTSSLIHSRRQRPCLRTSQTMDSFSSCNSKLSVSFAPKVSVHEYNKRFEKYTHDGWSSWFH